MMDVLRIETVKDRPIRSRRMYIMANVKITITHVAFAILLTERTAR